MSVSVGTNEQRIDTFYLSNKQKQGLKYLNSKRIILKLTVVHVVQICVCAWIYRWTKNCGKSGLGRRAVGPLDRGGPWAAGLLLAKPFCNPIIQFYLANISLIIEAQGLKSKVV